MEFKFKIIGGKRHRYIKRRCFNDDPLRIRTRVCMLGLATHTYMQNPPIPENAVKQRWRGERGEKYKNETKQNEAKKRRKKNRQRQCRGPKYSRPPTPPRPRRRFVFFKSSKRRSHSGAPVDSAERLAVGQFASLMVKTLRKSFRWNRNRRQLTFRWQRLFR